MLIDKTNTITVTENQLEDALSSQHVSKEIMDKIIRRLKFYDYLNESGEDAKTSKWIENFDLNSATINSLRRNRIYTEKQLKEFVRDKGIVALLNFRNIGEKRFEEMKIAFPWLADF